MADAIDQQCIVTCCTPWLQSIAVLLVVCVDLSRLVSCRVVWSRVVVPVLRVHSAEQRSDRHASGYGYSSKHGERTLTVSICVISCCSRCQSPHRDATSISCVARGSGGVGVDSVGMRIISGVGQTNFAVGTSHTSQCTIKNANEGSYGTPGKTGGSIGVRTVLPFDSSVVR